MSTLDNSPPHTTPLTNNKATETQAVSSLTLIILVSIISVVALCAIVILLYCCYQRYKIRYPHFDDISLLSKDVDKERNYGHSPKFYHSPKFQALQSKHRGHDDHATASYQNPTSHAPHNPASRTHQSTPTHHLSLQNLHKKGSTGELSKKMRMLTRSLSHRLLPSVETIPPVHELVHPVLQQPVLDQPTGDSGGMQDDCCGSAMFGLGKLCFSVTYIERVEMLHVNVHRAIHLPLHGARKFVNPYVKIKLTPHATIKYITKVHKHTHNPHFQESFVFRMVVDELQGKTLKLIVYDHCRVSSDVIVGHVNFCLRDISQSPSNHSRDSIWREIESEETTPAPYQGEVMLSISYDHESQKFTMGVENGRKVQLSDGSTPAAGVYVKVTILVAEQVWKSKRTKTAKSHPGTPTFNEEFSIKVLPNDLSHVNMMVAVYGKTSFSQCELIGRTTIGCYKYTTGQGLEHWIQMITSPKTPAQMWHILT